MAPNTERQSLWTAAKHGWMLSIVVGLAVLLIRFKALVPLVWQILVRNGTAHSIGDGLGKLLAFAAIVGGCALLVYAVRIGYRRTNEALGFTGNTGGHQSNSTIALRVIGRISLLINAPILYWAVFLFVLLPLLLKIPNASLRIGTTAALAGAFISMAVIVVLATHIGILLTKFSLKSLTSAPEYTAAFDRGNTAQLASYPQQGGYAQQGSYPFSQPNAAYAQPAGYYPPTPQAAPPAISNNPSGFYAQQNPYAQPQQAGYPVGAVGVDSQPNLYGQPEGYYPPAPQSGVANNDVGQASEAASPNYDDRQPQG